MSTVACQKDFTIVISTGASGPIAWWPLEAADNTHEVDIISGQVLANTGIGSYSRVLGRVGFGMECGAGAGFIQQGPAMKYSGNGFSIVGWFKHTQTGDQTQSLSVYYAMDLSGNTVVDLEVNESDYEVKVFIDGGPGGAALDVNGPPFPPGNVWHFFFLSFDPTDKKIRLSIDNGATVPLSVSAGVWPIPASTYNNSNTTVGSNSTLGTTVIDEIAWFPKPLNPAQVTYLYNGGAGRTWPISLPP